MRIAFVHTPMSTVPIPQRRAFWQNFDVRYHAAHPRLGHMKNILWELPHWMHWLGGVLVSHGFEHQEVVDLYSSTVVPLDHGFKGAAQIDEQHVNTILGGHPADVFLFSPMTPNLPFAYQLAGIVKRLYPESITIFGGVVATPLRKEVAAHPSVDYVVYDRGEVALPQLLLALESRSPVDEVSNLCFVDQSGSVRITSRSNPVDVSQIPFPKIDLFPESAGDDIRYLRQVYALGCPYQCAFCTIQTIGRRPGYFSTERVLSEINAYRSRYGSSQNIYFGDETFTLNRAMTMELCKALERAGDIEYDCQTRLDRLGDADLARALYRSGCRWIEIGIETLHQTSLDRFKQRAKANRAREILRILRDEGISSCSYLINGFPGQTCDDMRRSLDAACELIRDGLLQASYLFGLVPYPGSALFDRPDDYGIRLLHRDYARYHEDLPPAFESSTAHPDETYEVFLEGVQLLGEAMAAAPYFGTSPVDLGSYGEFWAGAHN